MPKFAVAVLMVASVAIFGIGQTSKTGAEQAAAHPLVGTWKMLSWTRELTASGQKSDALGPNPNGWINYSRDGRMMVVVVRSDRKTPAALVPTDPERIALYSSMLAYAGTYTVDDEKVTHNIDISWNQTWTGTNQVRFYKIEGNRLTLKGAPAKDAVDGLESVYTVVWEKVQ
jgi:hypothetical protein